MERAADEHNPYTLVLLDAMMPDMDGFEVAEQIRDERHLAGATIMMLSSADSHGDVARCRELGIDIYLRKPIAAQELYEAVVSALGLAGPKKPGHSAADSASKKQSVHPASILLAEDNAVNQRVTIGILERRGHFVIAVDDGREVLKALACQRFDLVLMDVQMPEMDGLEATRAIRLQEQETGAHIPIIALTAHAMKGDRDRCIEAGMDDYLTKPVEPKVIHEMIVRWASTNRRGTNDMEKKHATNTETNQSDSLENAAARDEKCSVGEGRLVDKPIVQTDLFDLASLQGRVEGDLDLLAEMIELHLTHSPLLLDELDAAVAAKDGEKVMRAAHTMKGMLKNMCAARSAEVALELESAGRAGEFDQVGRSLATLKDELEGLRVTLTEMTKEVLT